ncbi:low-density lipoprotein receptor-related protein 6-like [Stylophora pistillata]|uniref:low-density lipoprotein receptor-related protein 6-like n=1 Tax=Stylophora pistillata TaxID=50429 RepID=UPI000C04B860|nr:low-density lipoprotein receptor-related protein 6-like [Stylophora pistillata]
MGKSVWIWAFFILLVHKQRADVCRAYAVSLRRNHSASISIPPCLLILSSSNIIALDHETSDITSIKAGLSEAVTLDFHFSLGYIFWSDLIEQSIKRFSIDKGITTTVIANTGVCAGLAVEWRTSRLYWTDSTLNKIFVSDVHGLNQHSLITKLEEPRDIALDPDNGLIFWADWSRGVYPKIKRASLNGSQIIAIVSVNLQQPTGINLDRGNRRIFWVNSRIGTVESVDYDGDSRRALFKQSDLYPFGLAFSPPFLFLTAWQTLKQVYQLDAITGKLLRSYNLSNQKPMDIVAYDESRQPPASNPCTVNNGGCSHFCVPKSCGYKCVCSTGLALKQDGKTCQEKVKKFVLFTDFEARSINMISLDVNYSIAQPLLTDLYDQRPTAVDFDPVEDRLYWSDVGKGRIMSAFTNATSVKTLFSCNFSTGLAIDHVGRNIYWTDAGTNRIEVGRLDGTKRKLLLTNELEEPRTIVLDENNGIMVWTSWGSKPNIAKANMDGSGRHTIVTRNLSRPDGLTIDRVTNCVYWADTQQNTIEMSDLNGGHRQVILSSAACIKPFRLAFYQDALYWTDPSYKRIELYDLVDGKRKTVVLAIQKPTDIRVYDSSILYSVIFVS